MIAWSIFAVGGVYVWAGAPLIVAAAVLGVAFRPRIAASAETRALDWALLASAAAVGLQLLPLPTHMLTALSPRAQAVRLALLLAPANDGNAWETLSLNPGWTAYALALLLSAMLVFWSTRQLCAQGASRPLVVGVAAIGLVAAMLAIVQQARDPMLIYGVWAARDGGARPFGPFVNRNHFATWVVMGIPLAVGCVAASVSARRPAQLLAAELAQLLQSVGSKTAWVGIAAAVMTVGLAASTSRSGLIGLTAAMAIGFVVGRRRLNRRTRVWGVLGAIVLGGFLSAYVNVLPILSRVQETLEVGAGGRRGVWQDTTGLIHDFWKTGIGFGGFQTGMLVYQQSDRSMFVNQAHNQYLQLMAEGGVLVAAPALIVVFAFLRLFWIRLAADVSPAAWLRIGAMTALIAVAVQSCWETGLRMPANGILFAVAAGIAVHRPTGARVARGAAG